MKFKITLVLETPTFNFAGIAGSATCTLTFPVSGTMLKEDGGVSKDLPKGLVMVFQAPLSTIQGSVTTAHSAHSAHSTRLLFTPSKTATTQPAGTVIDLNGTEADAHGICVDMTDMKH